MTKTDLATNCTNGHEYFQPLAGTVLFASLYELRRDRSRGDKKPVGFLIAWKSPTATLI